MWNKEELKLFKTLTSPRKIQDFLDSTPYSSDIFYRSPRSVIRDKKAHCFDGCLFGAAALRMIGYKPLIVDLLAHNDDEHMLAIYKVDDYIGAVAKSNFSGLRFRDPIYKSLRELVMSYFEDYYNLSYEKTLRGYTVALDLSKFDHLDWMTSDENLEQIADATDKIKRYDILTRKQVKLLTKMDEKAYNAGLLGSTSEGLYKPN
jgi:hypothetical protein